LYDFTGEWEIDETMERLFGEGKQTSIVVGLETVSERQNELTPFPNQQNQGGFGNLYVDFLVNNLKPYIDARFRTKPEREYTGIIGSSHGGLMSFYAGLKRQEIFGKIGSFSPSFWFSDEIFNFAANTQNSFKDLRIHFVCGAKEIKYPTIIPDMLRMINLLKSLGYKNIEYKVQDDGEHSEWFWRREFPDAYQWLYLN
jgi:alpha-glucosidase